MNLELYAITMTPKTAQKVFKALKKTGFLIEGVMTDNTGSKSPRYYISKQKVLTKKDKMERNEITPLGVYRGTFTVMVNLVLDETEHVELNELFKGELKLKGFHLGTDGGWLGFPYFLIYTKDNYPELIKNMELGLNEIDQYLDSLTQKTGFIYDDQFREEQKQTARKLISNLKNENC